MTIMDAKLEFSDAQVLSLASGSARLSTNVFEMRALKDAWGTAITHDIGEGNNGLVVNMQVATAVTSGCTMIGKVYSHTGSAVASGTKLGEVSFPESSIAGIRRNFRIPSGTVQKWVGIQWSAATSDSVATAMDAWLGLDTETPST
jgi:hypothetical protein